MSGFVATLREQLVEAAAREQARRVPRRPRPRPRAIALAGVTALLVALVAVAAIGGLEPEPRVADRAPRPEPGVRELFGGSLKPGLRYRTREFVPALSFTVADDDWFAPLPTGTGSFDLERRNRTAERGSERTTVHLLSFARMLEVYDPHVRGLERSRTVAPADLYRWISQHPDVRAGARRSATVAGVPGTVFDWDVAFERPAHPDPWCRRNIGRECAAIAPGVSLLNGTHLRTYVLQAGPEPLLITLVARLGAGLDGLEAPAARLLETLRIGIR